MTDAANTPTGKTLRVTLVKSPIGAIRKHKACVQGLGLRRMHHSVTLQDTPEVRGMIHKIIHLVQFETL